MRKKRKNRRKKKKVNQKWWKCSARKKKFKVKIMSIQQNLRSMKISLISLWETIKNMNIRRFKSIKSQRKTNQPPSKLTISKKLMLVLSQKRNLRKLSPQNKFNLWKNRYFKAILLFYPNLGIKVLFYHLSNRLHMVYSKLKVVHVE